MNQQFAEAFLIRVWEAVSTEVCDDTEALCESERQLRTNESVKRSASWINQLFIDSQLTSVQS
jgi:hypothetical protein